MSLVGGTQPLLSGYCTPAAVAEWELSEPWLGLVSAHDECGCSAQQSYKEQHSCGVLEKI